MKTNEQRVKYWEEKLAECAARIPLSLRACAFFLLGFQLFGLQFVEKGIEALEVAFPKTPVLLQPDFKLLEAARAANA